MACVCTRAGGCSSIYSFEVCYDVAVIAHVKVRHKRVHDDCVAHVLGTIRENQRRPYPLGLSRTFERIRDTSADTEHPMDAEGLRQTLDYLLSSGRISKDSARHGAASIKYSIWRTVDDGE